MKNKHVAQKFNATSIRQHFASELLNIHFKKTDENLLGSGVKLCRRAKAFNTKNPHIAQIAVTKHPDNSITSNMCDVAHCGNAHLCAYCSAVKCKHLRDWLKEVHIPTVLASGRVNGLLTLIGLTQKHLEISHCELYAYLSCGLEKLTLGLRSSCFRYSPSNPCLIW